MVYRVHLSARSTNAKTGPIPVSTTEARSCPSTCPFMGSGCYAESGPLALHWKQVSDGKRGMLWDEFVSAIRKLGRGQLWRHNQAGDLPHVDGIVDRFSVEKLVRANTGKRGFTYTHHDVVRNYANRAVIKAANVAGFTVNLSGNSLAHADTLLATGAGPVVVVLPRDVSGKAEIATPGGTRVVVCPATYRDDVTCASCALCAVRDRPVIVGFPAHGSGARKASAVAS